MSETSTYGKLEKPRDADWVEVNEADPMENDKLKGQAASTASEAKPPVAVAYIVPPLPVRHSALNRPRQLDRFVRVATSRIHTIRFGSWLAYVGPHWYATLGMLAMIQGIGGMYVFNTSVEIGAFHRAVGFLMTCWSSYALLRCAGRDAGFLVAPPKDELADEAILEGKERRGLRPTNHKCQACGIIRPLGARHCDFCQICVAGWDHHCPWMSKCIGDSNTCAFYCFLRVAFGSLFYMVIVILMYAS